MPLVIHIGFHKTGSTAIQHFLHANRQLLCDAGNIIVPIGLSNWLGHPEISWAISERHDPWHDRSYSIQEIKSHYAPYLEQSLTPERVIVLTSEEFCRLEFSFANMLRLKEFLGPFQPIVVGYFRSPLDFLLSRFRHEVQQGAEQRDLRRFLLNFDNIFSAAFHWRTSVWEDVFDQRCVWRSYDQTTKIDGSVVRHFLGLLEIDASKIALDFANSEEKLHPTLLVTAQAIAQSGFSDQKKQKLWADLFCLTKELPKVTMQKVFQDIGLNSDISEFFSMLESIPINQTQTIAGLLK